MRLSIEQKEFPSTTHQSIWHAAMTMALFHEVIPPGLNTEEENDLSVGESNLHRFMVDMFSDMYHYPEAYEIPYGAYDVYMEGRDRRSMGHKNEPKESRLRNQFQQAIQFNQKLLFELGVHGDVADSGLSFESSVLDEMINRHNLRLIRGTQERRMTVLERLGMTILKVNERFILGNSKYPGMFTALNALANAGRGNWALTHVLRCDFRGLNKGFKPGLDDVLAVLPEKLRESILAMDEFMGSHQGKMTVQPLKNTTLYSPWKVSYTRDGRSIYGFHVEPQRLEVYIYLNHHENVSRVGYRLKEETEQLYGWFYEHIPSRECRCPNNRRVDIGGQAKRICGLMNRLEAINPDQMTVERLKQIIIKVLEERKAL